MMNHIELAVYDADNLTAPQEVISRRIAPTMLEEHNQKGGGSFKLPVGDPLVLEAGLLTEGKIIGTKVNGRPIGLWEIQKIQTVLIDVNGKSAEFKEFSGPTVRDWLTHAIVMPWSSLSSEDERGFNFSAPRGDWYKTADWKPVVSRGKVNLGPDFTPAGWPAGLNVDWIWNTTNTPPAGDVYFRREFTTTDRQRSARIVGTAADYMVVLIDGVRVFSVTEFAAARRSFSADVELEPGEHVLAVRARKNPSGGGNGANIGGIALAVLNNIDERQVEGMIDWDRIVWTGDGGNWVCNPYPATPPGFTVGGILLNLIKEAKERGVEAMARLHPTFTAAADSYGNAWDRTVDPSFKVGAKLDEVVAQICDSYADVWVDSLGRLSAAPERGVDRASGDATVQFERGRNVVKAATESTAEIANTVFVKSGSKLVETLGPQASRSKYGRRETYLSAVNASSDGTAPHLVKQLFDKYADPRRTPTLEIYPDDESTPWEDFNVGDWVLAPSDEDDTKLIRRRVVSISVGETGDTARPTYAVELDTIQETLDSRLARWLEELGNSSMSGGVSGTSAAGSTSQADLPVGGTSTGTPKWTGTTPLAPAPSLNDRKPSAPTGIKAVGDLYTEPSGGLGSRLLVSWEHSGFDTMEKIINVTRYEVWGRPRGADQDWQMLQLVESNTRATVYGLPTRQSDGSPLTWEVFVYAFTPEGARSDPSTITATAMQLDTEAPLQPSAPALSVRSVVVTVTWDFKDLNGAEMPLDFDHAVVEAESPNGWVSVGSLLLPEDKVLFSGFGYGTQSVRIKAVDTAGNASPVSETVKIVTAPLVDADLILSELDAAETTVKNAGSILISPNVTLTKKFADSDAAMSAASSQLKTLAETTLPKLTSDLSDAAGRLTTLTSTTIPGLQASVNGKSAIHRKTVAPVAADSTVGAVGDRWEHWSNLNSNGKLLATYRRQSTGWLQEAMDPTYLPKVDIGEGTFGELNGDRIVAQSILAQHVNAESIAAGTAAFQTVDAKNLFVTGTSSLNEVVARRLAAETGMFMELTVGQLTAGTAAMDELTAEKVFADIFQTNKITTAQLTVTSEMTAALLRAKKVEASEIDVNSLRADTAWMGTLAAGVLTADSITGTMIKGDQITGAKIAADAIGAKHTLTGPLIRTAASGARAEFTKEGFRVLSSTGTEMVKLGYGISTGMAVRHPATGRMTQLTDMMFGTQVLDGTTVYNNSYTNIFANGSGAVTLRNSNGVPLYFTAYSSQHLLLISLSYDAWVANGLPSAGSRENCNGTVRVTIWTRDDKQPPYNMDYFGTSLAQPYRMVSSNTVTWMCTPINLSPGTEYRVRFDINNYDTVTAQNFIRPLGATVVSIPI